MCVPPTKFLRCSSGPKWWHINMRPSGGIRVRWGPEGGALMIEIIGLIRRNPRKLPLSPSHPQKGPVITQQEGGRLQARWRAFRMRLTFRDSDLGLPRLQRWETDFCLSRPVYANVLAAWADKCNGLLNYTLNLVKWQILFYVLFYYNL